MSQMAIDYRDPHHLQPRPRNARTHSKKQIRQIAKSIESFGFSHPILTDEHDRILCGHARCEAAKLLKMDSVPTVQIDHLSDEQKRAFVIASNRLAELAGWDEELLALELGELEALELDFDLTSIGFETAELDQILGALGSSDEPDEADEVPPLREGQPISEPGDLWLLGPHRLLCADATKAESYEQLLGDEKAQLVLSDIPYNLEIPGHVSGLGKAKHDNFAMASGEMSIAEFTRFLTTIFRLMAGASVLGSIHFIFIDWRHLLELLRAGRIAYTELKNIVVWVKSAGGMGSLYRSQHEFIAVFKSGDAPHVNNVELGRFGRNRTNVWTHAGMNSFQPDREEMLASHPTVKPIGLMADAILDCSDRERIVLDPFVGSGTTILAAERTGRRCYAMEIDPRYVDVSLRRYRQTFGVDPVNRETGLTLTELEQRRNAPAAAA